MKKKMSRVLMIGIVYFFNAITNAEAQNKPVDYVEPRSVSSPTEIRSDNLG